MANSQFDMFQYQDAALDALKCHGLVLGVQQQQAIRQAAALAATKARNPMAPIFTKKHYEAIAKTIANDVGFHTLDDDVAEASEVYVSDLLDCFVNMFMADNPNFKDGKFRHMCGQPDVPDEDVIKLPEWGADSAKPTLPTFDFPIRASGDMIVALTKSEKGMDKFINMAGDRLRQAIMQFANHNTPDRAGEESEDNNG